MTAEQLGTLPDACSWAHSAPSFFRSVTGCISEGLLLRQVIG
jgi:hypothetical protein